MIDNSNPATRALASLNVDHIPAWENQKKRPRTPAVDGLASIPTFSKRQRIPFDMTDIISAVTPLEQSYGFPSIEWSYDDDPISSKKGCKDQRRTSWEGVSNCATNEETSISKGLHHRSSSESLSGKASRGVSLVRAKSKTLCLVSLASCSTGSTGTRTRPTSIEGSNRLATWETSRFVLGLPPTGGQESIPSQGGLALRHMLA